MAIYEEDPDVVRWGLHHLVDVCSLSNSGSAGPVTHYDLDLSQVNYVKQEYCQSPSLNVENDEMIAWALQEELSRVADAESLGSSCTQGEHRHESILSQDWAGQPETHYNSVSHSNQEDSDEEAPCLCPDPEGIAVNAGSQQYSPVIEDDSVLDGEVGKRLNQMCPVPHVPRTNGEIPSVDEATSDHERLLKRLELYELDELKVSGDGNCQVLPLYPAPVISLAALMLEFRSLSDQIYRTFEHHKFVREQIVNQLKSYPELYEGYVPMGYDEYVKRMSKNGEWGDHVTLQAAADSYGLRIFVITSFKDTCYIEILPRDEKSKRMITLSFWAEVHYNSIYPKGELPPPELKKKKKWWSL